MNETSGVLLLLLVPILVAGAVALAQRPALGFRSKHPVDIATLPALLNRFAPSVAPVLAMNGGRYGLMNDAPPENAWAQCQEEFAAWHNLTSRQTLDREACETVFVALLGALLHEDEAFLPACWAAHERALLAVIGLQVFCNDRQGASRLADDLNCLQRGLLRRRIDPLPLWRLCEVPLQRVLAAPGMTDWLAMHVSVRSALAGVYGRDLRLPSVCFRWLKGVDRTPWYALHSADTAKVFVEGAGARRTLCAQAGIAAARRHCDDRRRWPAGLTLKASDWCTRGSLWRRPGRDATIRRGWSGLSVSRPKAKARHKKSAVWAAHKE